MVYITSPSLVTRNPEVLKIPKGEHHDTLETFKGVSEKGSVIGESEFEETSNDLDNKSESRILIANPESTPLPSVIVNSNDIQRSRTSKSNLSNLSNASSPKKFKRLASCISPSKNLHKKLAVRGRTQSGACAPNSHHMISKFINELHEMKNSIDVIHERVIPPRQKRLKSIGNKISSGRDGIRMRSIYDHYEWKDQMKKRLDINIKNADV